MINTNNNRLFNKDLRRCIAFFCALLMTMNLITNTAAPLVSFADTNSDSDYNVSEDFNEEENEDNSENDENQEAPGEENSDNSDASGSDENNDDSGNEKSEENEDNSENDENQEASGEENSDNSDASGSDENNDDSGNEKSEENEDNSENDENQEASGEENSDNSDASGSDENNDDSGNEKSEENEDNSGNGSESSDNVDDANNNSGDAGNQSDGEVEAEENNSITENASEDNTENTISQDGEAVAPEDETAENEIETTETEESTGISTANTEVTVQEPVTITEIAEVTGNKVEDAAAAVVETQKEPGPDRYAIEFTEESDNGMTVTVRLKEKEELTDDKEVVFDELVISDDDEDDAEDAISKIRYDILNKLFSKNLKTDKDKDTFETSFYRLKVVDEDGKELKNVNLNGVIEITSETGCEIAAAAASTAKNKKSDIKKTGEADGTYKFSLNTKGELIFGVAYCGKLLETWSRDGASIKLGVPVYDKENDNADKKLVKIADEEKDTDEDTEVPWLIKEGTYRLSDAEEVATASELERTSESESSSDPEESSESESTSESESSTETEDNSESDLPSDSELSSESESASEAESSSESESVSESESSSEPDMFSESDSSETESGPYSESPYEDETEGIMWFKVSDKLNKKYNVVINDEEVEFGDNDCLRIETNDSFDIVFDTGVRETECSNGIVDIKGLLPVGHHVDYMDVTDSVDVGLFDMQENTEDSNDGYIRQEFLDISVLTAFTILDVDESESDSELNADSESELFAEMDSRSVFGTDSEFKSDSELKSEFDSESGSGSSKDKSDSDHSFSIELSDEYTKDAVDIYRLDGESLEKIKISEDDIVYADNLSIGTYVVTSKTKRVRYICSDDESYEITISYDESSGIPDDAVPSIKELNERDSEYKDYIDKATEAFESKKSIKNTARVYYIALVDPETNTEYVPDESVEIDISLSGKRRGSSCTDLNVVYFTADEENDMVIPGMSGDTDSDSAEFMAETLPVYAVVRYMRNQILTATDGKSYEITVEYDSNTGIPEDAVLEVTELKENDPNFDGYVSQANEILGKDKRKLLFARPFDIKLVDPDNGEKYEPDENVKVSMKLLTEEVEKAEELSVVHFKDTRKERQSRAARKSQEKIENQETMSGEIVEAEVVDGSVEFETGSFSVFVFTGYTVDFHWGEYTFNLPGGDTIFLSELLETLINGASETEDTAQLQKVLENPKLVEKVEFTNPALIQVDEVVIADPEEGNDVFEEDETLTDEDIQQSEAKTDWRLWSLAPFDTEETLTIRLTDGETVEIRVTDINYGDGTREGEMVTRVGNARVTADGVTYNLQNNGTADGWARVYAYSNNCMIHNAISYNRHTYTVQWANTGVGYGNFTKFTKIRMDAELIARAAGYSFNLPEMKTDVDAATKAQWASEGFVAGANNDAILDREGNVTTPASDNKVWKKATYNPNTNAIDYEMKYFQALKENVPLDFIFIYDDSITMFDGNRWAPKNNAEDPVRIVEAQGTRVIILEAAKALLSDAAKNGYNIRVAAGGAANGDTGHSGWYSSRTDLDNVAGGFDDLEEYLATYHGGANGRGGGVTDHTVGVNNAYAMAQESVNAGRTPIVIYLSDFVDGGGSADFRRLESKLNALHGWGSVYGLKTIGQGDNFRTRAICSGDNYLYHMRDEFPMGVQQLEAIIQDAIGYYMKDKVTITDNMSSALSDITPTNGSANTGSGAGAKGKNAWTLGGTKDSEGKYPGAGTIYTETFSVTLDPNVVYVGAMPTNGVAGVYVKDNEVNTLTPDENDPEHLHLGKGLVFLLGEMDEKNRVLEVSDTDKNPKNPVNGISFKLTEADDSGSPKTGATPHTYSTQTEDGVVGVLRVPYKEGTTPILELGKTYVLEEDSSSVNTYNSGNDASANDLKVPDKTWLIKVGANGVVVTEVNGVAGQTPEMTVAPAANGKPARFVIWNQIVVEARLIPITVQKKWDTTQTDHRDPVPFEIYGVYQGTGSHAANEREKLVAYDGKDSTTANTVKYITADDNSVDHDANIWTQTVYVPDWTDSQDKFFDYTEVLNISALDPAHTFTVGETEYTVEELKQYANKDGEIFIGGTYHYAIEEGHMYYEDGWYSPSYPNNVPTIGEHNVTSTLTIGENWEEIITVEDWVDIPSTYSTTDFQLHINTAGFKWNDFNPQTMSSSYYKPRYNVLGNLTGYTGDYTNNTNLVEHLKYIELEVTNSNEATGAGSVTLKFDLTSHADTGAFLIHNIPLPATWANNGLTGPHPWNIANLRVTKLFFVDDEDNVIKITGGGTSNTMTYGPDYTGDVLPLAIQKEGTNPHTDRYIKQDSLKVWGTRPDIETHYGSDRTVNNCTLLINNEWTPNTLIPVTVTKNWVNSEGGSVPVPTEVIAANTPIEFTISGTTSKGTSPVKVFSSDSWNSETEGKLTDATTWTGTFYVPTFDVLNTYNKETRTCEAYTYDNGSISEDTTLTAEVGGEVRGEWSEVGKEYQEGHSITTPGEYHEGGYYVIDSDRYDALKYRYYVRFLTNTSGFTIRKVNIKFHDNGTNERYQLELTVKNPPIANDEKTYFVEFRTDNFYIGRFVLDSIVVNDNYTNIEDPDIRKEIGGSTQTVVLKSSSSLPPLMEWRDAYYDEPTTDTQPTVFTLTNTFHPYVPVTLSSTFQDQTDDRASTGMIKSVVYTINGTTDSGKSYAHTVKTTADPTVDTTNSTKTEVSISSNTVYVPKGNYTVTQTAYIIGSSAREYPTTAFKTTYGSQATAGTAQSVTLNAASSTQSVSFANERKMMPVTVQTRFDPTLTDEDIASIDTRPMKDRSVSYTLKYNKGDGTVQEVQNSAFVLKDGSFDSSARNYINNHTLQTVSVPTYSVFGELTDCNITGNGLAEALPDYVAVIDSEEKDGKLVFTILASVNRAPVTISKSWDEDIPTNERQNITLTFSIRRDDGKAIYGTTEDNKTLSVTTGEDGEAIATFDLGKDAEDTVIYLPAIRSTDVDASGNPVKYILTETAPADYYVNFADMNNEASNQFEQTRPGGKSGAAGESTTNEARFVLNQGGIMIDVNNARNPYICKIVETFGDTTVEVPFRTLNKAVTYARTYGNGAEMGAENPVKIEMLVDYEIPETDKVTLNQATDNIIITTADKTGKAYVYTGSGDKATIKRGFTPASAENTNESQLFTVTGNGAMLTFTNIIIDGDRDHHSGGKGSLVYVNGKGGETNVPALVIGKGATLQNAKSSGSTDGGAVYVTHGKVTVDAGGSIQNCVADNSHGGAIYAEKTGAVINISGSLTGNSAVDGGAIKASEDVRIYIYPGATLSGNTASKNGGAIYASGSVNMTGPGATLSGNTASKNGGAIYASGSVNMTGGSIDNNTAAEKGGAIYQDGDNALTLTNVTFGKANTTNSGCTAAWEGGCIYSTGNVVTITDCNFYYGVAGDASKPNKTRGGAIYYKGSTSLSIYGCIFDHCSVQTTSPNSGWGNGGAIFVDDTDIALTIDKSNSGRRSSFTDCFAHRFGGAVMYEKNNGKSVSIFNTDFTGCYTETRGGGAVCPDSNKTTIDNCTFKGCYDNSGSGGGAIQLHPDKTPGNNPSCTISNSTFEDCYTVSGYGGAIYEVSGSVPVTLINVSIDGHTNGNPTSLATNINNAKFGAAIYSNGNLTIKQSETGTSEIKNCSAYDTNGGAVQVASGKTMTFEGNVVIFNNKGTGTLADQQKNVVLDQNNNTTINTSTVGLGSDARIGVYVTGTKGVTETDPYKSHGGFEDDFGTYPDLGSTDNFDAFTNDRNGLYGEISTTANKIRWASYLCKLTDASGNLLYKDAEHKDAAVYKFLKTQDGDTNGKKTGGFNAAQGTLYTVDGTEVANNAPVQVQMLRNYTQPSTDQPTVSGGRAVTFTTANKTATDNLGYSAGDIYIYDRGSDTTKEADRATITRGADGGSMFTVDGDSASLTTKKLIFNGGNALSTPLTAGTANGGIVNATNGNLTVGEATVMKNSTAVNGGAIYSANGVTVSGTSTNKVQFWDCNASSGNGGAIYTAGDSTEQISISNAVSISDAVFEDCYTNKDNGQGGAMYFTNGTQKLIDVEVNGVAEGHKNSQGIDAKDGGGIYLKKGNLTLRHVVLQDCHVNRNGGGIYMEEGTLTVNGNENGQSEFKECAAPDGNGGTIYNESFKTKSTTGVTVSIVNTTFDGHFNHPNNLSGPDENEEPIRDPVNPGSDDEFGEDGSGGNSQSEDRLDGHEVDPAEPHLDDNVQNARNGGAIYMAAGTLSLGGSGEDDAVTFKNCTVTGNGGAIYNVSNSNYENATVKLQNVTIDGHDQSRDGGALDATFVNAVDGGAIYLASGTLSITGGEFHNLRARTYGGVIYSGSSSRMTVTGTNNATVLIRGNTGFRGRPATTDTDDFAGHANAGSGGAIYNNQGNLRVTDAQFYDFIASQDGGVIFDNNSDLYTDIDTVNLQNVTIDGYHGGMQDGEYNAQRGGAIFTATQGDMRKGGSTRLSKCQIVDCAVSSQGGAIFNQSARREVSTDTNVDEPTIHLVNNTVIDGNETRPETMNNAQRGGAILISNGTLVMEDSTIRDCKTTTDGGGITSYGGGTQFKNQSGEFGVNDYTVKLKNTTIDNCSSQNGGGISIKQILTMLNSTITNCAATNNGGAIYLFGEDTNKRFVRMNDSTSNANVITGNTAGQNGAGIYVREKSVVSIAGAPNFGGTDASGANINTVGTGTTKREDIYIAGYLGLNGADPKLAESLIVTGKLYDSLTTEQAKGQIWVGAQQQDNEDNNHWDTLKQFAKFADALMTGTGDNMKIDESKLSESDVEKIYAAFRNATLTDVTYGMTGDGQTGGIQCIYWEGVQGSRKVILRKVGKKVEDSTYKLIEGAKFTIHKGNSSYAYTPQGETAPLSDLDSKASGVFWIGTLPYGVYYLHETTVPDGYTGHGTFEGRWFFMVVGDDTVPGSRNGAYMSEGYANREAAKTGYEDWKAGTTP
ncbi:SpaA isopeptide-forming pilin-related protein [Oribacterium sp. NK2B42]|uniref:SpaA isopeptide-forming pilin-related protein n=1 Tax=Oribacterium sp. NK2B42 TaxID=689781 RepID=UPI00042728AE|nr:SpaA isopeptide-forming pilin-related protein [Oribacterium sp. NK2B42]